MSTFDLECLIKKSTCLQSSNLTCIDLIFTKVFKNTYVIEVGISDHHCLILTALKSLLLKGNTKLNVYRDYSSVNIDHEILHKHAPIKKKDIKI